MVGPHGAGLANQVFMSEGSFSLEILFEDYVNPVFEVVAGERIKIERILLDCASSTFAAVRQAAVGSLLKLYRRGRGRTVR